VGRKPLSLPGTLGPWWEESLSASLYTRVNGGKRASQPPCIPGNKEEREPLSLPVYPGGICWYTPLLVYTPPYHPGYTITRPPSHTCHRWSTAVAPVAALTRAVTELHISDEPLTVTFPFHCWILLFTRFTVGLVISVSGPRSRVCERVLIMLGRQSSSLSTTRFTVGRCCSARS